jgi:hypothetical protein
MRHLITSIRFLMETHGSTGLGWGGAEGVVRKGGITLITLITLIAPELRNCCTNQKERV